MVTISGEPIHFRRGERTHTEHSYKFTVREFREFAAQAGFELTRFWTDEQERFCVLCFHVAENVRRR